MSGPFSELEKENLEVHVDMSRQRYETLHEKVETLDERMNALISELSGFRQEHAENMATIREEQSVGTQGTHKLVIGAAATVVGGVLNTLVVLLIALL